MIVFCNAAPACDWLSHVLAASRKAGQVSKLHGDLQRVERRTEYETFVDAPTGILVTTDCGSRGLDILDVDHVVLFDFPGNTTDYLHRIGRTGRAGKRGYATSLVAPKDAAAAHLVQNTARANRELPGLASKQARSAAPALQKRKRGRSGTATGAGYLKKVRLRR